MPVWVSRQNKSLIQAQTLYGAIALSIPDQWSNASGAARGGEMGEISSLSYAGAQFRSEIPSAVIFDHEIQ